MYNESTLGKITEKTNLEINKVVKIPVSDLHDSWCSLQKINVFQMEYAAKVYQKACMTVDQIEENKKSGEYVSEFYEDFARNNLECAISLYDIGVRNYQSASGLEFDINEDEDEDNYEKLDAMQFNIDSEFDFITEFISDLTTLECYMKLDQAQLTSFRIKTINIPTKYYIDVVDSSGNRITI